MIPDLSRRDGDLREWMDDPDCDPARLNRTYVSFRCVNALVSRWRSIYRQQIRPLLAVDRRATLLDLGSGGGDVGRALVRWAARDGLALDVTAADPDPRAYAFASSLPPVPGITFRQASSADLVAAGARFDVVTSNHLLHHLDEPSLHGVLADSARLATRLVVHSDLERSRAAYLAYGVAARALDRRSFVRADGLLSLRRSYRAGELAAVAGEPWRVERRFPSRLLLLRRLG